MLEAGEKKYRLAGVILTLAVHAAGISLVSFSGIKYIYPPPAESTFLLDFEQDAPAQVIEQHGREPQAEETLLTEKVKLVQKSESPQTVSKENLTPETRQDNFGDVEAPAPKSEPALDPRASFPGMAKKDTSLTAPHSARKESPAFKAGQSDGNTGTGRTDDKPNAHVSGRNMIGNIPRPVYNVQESGTVVVTIWVDNYGNVQKAVPGGDGTTVTDKTLWNAARKAAMETHFNMDANSPALQEGTITYNFTLK